MTQLTARAARCRFFIDSYPQIITDMSTETRRHISVGRHKTERVLVIIIIIINNNNSNPNNVESHGYYMVITSS